MIYKLITNFFFWTLLPGLVSCSLQPSNQNTDSIAPGVSKRLLLGEIPSVRTPLKALQTVKIGGLQHKKREVYLFQHIRVRLYFHCPVVRQQTREFQWAVYMDTEHEGPQFAQVLNIDSFGHRFWDNEENPPYFSSSWMGFSHNQLTIAYHCCTHMFSGYFEGTIELGRIYVQFITHNHNRERLPMIIENCRERVPRSRTCSAAQMEAECAYQGADVWYPEQ